MQGIALVYRNNPVDAKTCWELLTKFKQECFFSPKEKNSLQNLISWFFLIEDFFKEDTAQTFEELYMKNTNYVTFLVSFKIVLKVGESIPREFAERDYYLPNPSVRAGYDTRSIFKRSLTGLNSEFSFS